MGLGIQFINRPVPDPASENMPDQVPESRMQDRTLFIYHRVGIKMLNSVSNEVQ